VKSFEPIVIVGLEALAGSFWISFAFAEPLDEVDVPELGGELFFDEPHAASASASTPSSAIVNVRYLMG
jgi:hypothetical protein